MKFHLPTSEIFIPDGLPVEPALARTTHMSISAHQDDIEILAVDGILQCFQQENKWFTGVVLTNGRGSPRDDLYKDFSDDQMHEVRFKEQRKAAIVGEYAAQVLLDYPSASVKNGKDKAPVEDLLALLKASRPEIVYTHNLADKHDTHVATAIKTIEAIRLMPASERPQKLIGSEVWRSLDWLVDSEKVLMEVSKHQSLQTALMGVFDSQICGGKRYDLATMGRRTANATFFASHQTDASTGLVYGMDMTPLILDPSIDIQTFTAGLVDHFAREVKDRINSLL